MKWRVVIRDVRRAEVIVEADDYMGAYESAGAVAMPADATADRSCDVREQIDGPWVWPYIGWIGEPIEYGATGSVVVLQRALGRRFDDAEIRELKTRFARIGFPVVDCWNANSDKASFGLGYAALGHILTQAEADIILAPIGP